MAADISEIPAACYDCGLPYFDDGFADLVVPHDVWAKISPTRHEGGLLCPTCLVRAAERAGVRCHAAFRSGPFCRTGADYDGLVASARAAGGEALKYAAAIEELAALHDEAVREAGHWQAVAECEALRAGQLRGNDGPDAAHS